MIELKCQQCGKQFSAKPSRRQKYCSFICYNLCRPKHKGQFKKGHVPWNKGSHYGKVENLGLWATKGKSPKKPKPKQTKICTQCGKVFIPSRASRKFCSANCQYDWMSENLRGGRHHQWKERTLIVCQTCGKEFYKLPRGDRLQKYCSMQCQHEALRSGQWVKCENCGKRIWKTDFQLRKYSHHFCSYDCFLKRKLEDEEWRELLTKKILKGLLKRPTSLEKRLMRVIKKYNLPYEYVGDGEVLIGYKNPDFINNNGEKKVIEVANRYHHQGNWAEKRIEHFKKYGFNCIMFWEDELDEQTVVKRIGGAEVT